MHTLVNALSIVAGTWTHRALHALPRVALWTVIASSCRPAAPLSVETALLQFSRLESLPIGDTSAVVVRGRIPLRLGSTRDGFVYVPPQYGHGRPMPLAILLHGATGEAARMLDVHMPLADSLGVLLLAIDSRAVTWDAIHGEAYGPDVRFLDAALSFVLKRYAVDRSRLSVHGFSDGATYALALARANGDVFHKVVAHAPGFLLPVLPVRSAACFITHGVRDAILPIDATSRRLVPELQRAGYPVTYLEWDGPHLMSRELLWQAMTWAIAGAASNDLVRSGSPRASKRTL